jgi:ABC-type phosphate transport system permease subunit
MINSYVSLSMFIGVSTGFAIGMYGAAHGWRLLKTMGVTVLVSVPSSLLAYFVLFG